MPIPLLKTGLRYMQLQFLVFTFSFRYTYLLTYIHTYIHTYIQCYHIFSTCGKLLSNSSVYEYFEHHWKPQIFRFRNLYWYPAKTSTNKLTFPASGISDPEPELILWNSFSQYLRTLFKMVKYKFMPFRFHSPLCHKTQYFCPKFADTHLLVVLD
jgi:hypothetical protein